MKPAKPIKQAVTNLKSDKQLELLASWTMASNISAVTGSFLTIGFARVYLSPSSVALTNGCAMISVRPAVVWTHPTASSTADLGVCLDMRGSIRDVFIGWGAGDGLAGKVYSSEL